MINLCQNCGGKAEIKRKKPSGYMEIYKNGFLSLKGYYVRCVKCHVKTDIFDDKEHAIYNWNRGMTK